METKTHWKKQFNYDYMGSYSLPNGDDVILTIKETKRQDVTGQNGKKEMCFVAYFVEKADWIKPMILNKVNCKTIEKLYLTPYIEEWGGKKLRIGIDRVKAFGDEVDALRVRPVIPVERTELVVGSEKFNDAKKFMADGGKIESIKKHYTMSAEVEKLLTETK